MLARTFLCLELSFYYCQSCYGQFSKQNDVLASVFAAWHLWSFLNMQLYCMIFTFCPGIIFPPKKELKERMFVFQIVSSDEHSDKLSFLKQLCRHIANSMFRQDTDTYLRQMRAEDLGLESSDLTVSNFGTRAYRSLHRKVLQILTGRIYFIEWGDCFSEMFSMHLNLLNKIFQRTVKNCVLSFTRIFQTFRRS